MLYLANSKNIKINMRFFTLLIIGILLIPIVSFSKEVSLEDAMRVAKNFYYNNSKTTKNLDYENLNLSLNYIKSEESTFYYVFNIDGFDGFVITSAQDFTRPILGFSDQNNIDFSNLSPELQFMLDGYIHQIQYGIDNNARANQKNSSAWQNLQMPNMNRTSVVSSLGPLILTTWNQSPYYNDMCPTNSAGEHAVVGCVAVAMAQVMKYYNFPAQGSGSRTYTDNSGSVQDAAFINYAQQTYAWNNMPVSLSGANDDVAKLMYHCGHTVSMDWEVEGSGTQSSYIITALKNYFGYADGAVEYSRQNWNGTYNYTDAVWEQMIRDELDALRPIVYSGFSSAGGHAWECDGYKSDGDGGYLYHMNFGWGGYGNGYFALDNLVSGTTPGGETDYFDYGHQIILGIQPGSNYPENCSGSRLVTGFEGLIGDGSGNDLYQNNLDCQTLILPDCARGKTMVSFDQFDLSTGDVIYLYNGSTTSDPVLAVLDENNLPSGQYTSTGEGLLVRFITDGTGRGNGWDLRYSSYVCGSITTTQAEGSLTDGSGICDYEVGASCYWYIQPVNASQITLNFTEFNLDSPDHDYVTVYEGTTSNILATYKQSTPPPANIVVNSDKAIIRFRAYATETIVGTGWALNYTSNVVGIDDLIDFEEVVKVYPNPFNGDAFVEVSNPKSETVRIVLTDIVGKVIISKELDQFTEKRTIALSDMGQANFEEGIYLLNVQIGNQSKTYKLISE